jgi:hypothetical protein
MREELNIAASLAAMSAINPVAEGDVGVLGGIETMGRAFEDSEGEAEGVSVGNGREKLAPDVAVGESGPAEGREIRHVRETFGDVSGVNEDHHIDKGRTGRRQGERRVPLCRLQ